MNKVMRAIRIHKFGGPKMLTLEENVPVPEAERDQVLIRVHASGVNPVDTYLREGAFAVLPSLPYIPGKDGAGVVEAVGEHVSDFQPGQRVFFCNLVPSEFGSCAEYTLAHHKNVFPLQNRLSFAQGSAIGIPYFTAYRALILKARALAKETVLVHGASGAVGIASVQLARAYGMTVFATAGTADGLEAVKSSGAHHVFCHKDKNYIAKLKEATEDRGVDVILEMLANINLGKDLSILAPKGRIMVIGNRGSVNINPRDMMGPETSITGIALFATTADEWSETASAIVKGIEDGWVNPIIDKEYPLEQASQAHHDIIHSTGAKGKLVISVS